MFTQQQIEITRRKLLGKLADRVRPRQRDMRASERQQTWSFMLWSFVLVHVLDKFGVFTKSANASEDETDLAVDETANTQDAFADADAGDDGADAETDTANAANDAATPVSNDVDLDLDTLDEEDDSYDTDGADGDSGASNPVLAGPVGSAAPLGNLAPNFAPLPPIEVPPPLPDLDFFDGFSDFASELGFGEGGADFLGLLEAGVQSNVGIAISFLQSPVVAVDVWKGLGDFDSTEQPNGNDSFDIDWTIQLNGVIGDQVFHAESTNGTHAGADTTTTFQHADTDASLQGNSAVLVDGGDWDDLLWVKGNYYEFNTVIQVNVLWDNDVIHAEFEGEAAADTPALGEIHSGGNVQHNAAIISEVLPTEMQETPSSLPVQEPVVDQAIDLSPEPYDALIEQACCDDAATPPPQLILGEQASYNAVVQQNSVVDMDVLNYDLQDLVDGLGVFNIEDQFANVFGSGHEQHNDVQIVQEQTALTAGWTAKSFAAAHQAIATTTVSGDYYEFNTIIQINIIEDSQELVWSGTAGETALSSGGNMQFNTAALLHDDAQDQLFVNGNYTEYNLVLQVNAIEDNDTIGQTSTMTHTGLQPTTDGVGVDGTDGAGGIDGDSTAGPSIDYIVPDFTVDTSAMPGYA
ncbi:MAG: hypothetical protein AAFQ35_09135 [Pseudomonadota bacterium]